jgi:glycosyltransferase involved in cell wall biosynthesis
VDQQFDKLNGVYIVSETGSMKPSSGAHVHIQAGLKHLGVHFNMSKVLLCKPYVSSPLSARSHNPSYSGIKFKVKSFFKWLYLFFKNHISFFRYYNEIKRLDPDFIYERAAYLNFNGLLIAKLLRIPHFYEVNGIIANDHRKYFPTVASGVAAWLERKAYKNSSYGFYVGGINTELKVPSEKSTITQNGIDTEFALRFKHRQNLIGDRVQILFIGYAMTHHRLDILCSALNLVDNPQSFHLHLIGSGLEHIDGKIPPSMPVTFHGVLDHDGIADLMNKINVGIIPYALDYYSNVKTFLYGAGKLATIVPDVRNFRTLFSADEVLFIKNGDPLHLAKRLNELSKNPTLVTDYGARIYKKIVSNFTWEHIYDKIKSDIEERVNETAALSLAE